MYRLGEARRDAPRAARADYSSVSCRRRVWENVKGRDP